MDRNEGVRRKVVIVEAREEIPDEEKVEPWAWGLKDIPSSIARRMQQYQEFLNRVRDGDDR